MSNKSILVYNNQTGIPKYTVDFPWPEGYEDILESVGESLIVVESDKPISPSDYWVNPETKEAVLASFHTDSLTVEETILLRGPSQEVHLQIPSGAPNIIKAIVNSSVLVPINRETNTVTLDTSSMSGEITIELTSGAKSNQVVIPVTSIEDYRISKWEQVKTIRSTKEALTNTSIGAVNSDTGSVSKMLGLLETLRASEPGTAISYRLANNSFVTLTLSQLENLVQEVSTQVSELFSYSWVLEDQLNSATTLAQLDAIDIDSGWPS